MAGWQLPLLVFVVWLLWHVACISGVQIANARKGVPVGRRGGSSMFPGIPLFPLFFWGLACFVDSVVAPWGTWVIGGLHVISMVLSGSIARDVRGLYAIDRST